MQFFVAFVISCLALCALASDVIVLDSSNFEKETQAATGATTGDWLIKFYAPWCGHCKTMAPTFEEVATKLKGRVNVAKVDVTANRDIGVRFDIKGFPTVKFLHQGQVFNFRGRRTVDELVNFALEGYALSDAQEVPGPTGYFTEIIRAFKEAYVKARNDMKKGTYFSAEIVLITLPVIFILTIVYLIYAIATDTYEPPKGEKNEAAPKEDKKEK